MAIDHTTTPKVQPFDTHGLVLHRVDSDPARWSLYSPRVSDKAIQEKSALPLLTGGAASDGDGGWSRPNQTDYILAAGIHEERNRSERWGPRAGVRRGCPEERRLVGTRVTAAGSDAVLIASS
jgi:hypothetical protein